MTPANLTRWSSRMCQMPGSHSLQATTSGAHMAMDMAIGGEVQMAAIGKIRRSVHRRRDVGCAVFNRQ